MKIGEQGLIWKAQAGSQVAFLSCPVYECLIHGPRGTGKTDALIMDFLKDVGVGWGAEWKGLLLRRTYPELEDVIAKTQKLFPLLAPGAKYNSAKHEWRWPTGEVLYLRFADKMKDYNHFHGHSYTWMAWEELCTWATLDLYLKLQSCMRSSNKEVADRIRIRATANPLGPGHNAVKKRFKIRSGENIFIINEKNPDTGKIRQRCHIRSRLSENKALLDADPDYVDKLYAACKGNPAYIEAWINGSWDIIAGGMFDDILDENYHYVKDFKIPGNWKITRALDWGSSRPFCCLWFATADGEDYIDARGKYRSTVRGDQFLIAEWYGCTAEDDNEGLRMPSQDVARGIIQRELEMGIYHRCTTGIADPAIFASHDGSSVATKMSQWFQLDDGNTYSGPHFQKADNARVPGWEAIRDHLNNAIPDDDGFREKPGLFIFYSCVKARDLIPTTQRSEKKPDDVDTDTCDHLQDTLRYFIKGAKIGSSSTGRIARSQESPYKVHRNTKSGRVRQR